MLKLEAKNLCKHHVCVCVRFLRGVCVEAVADELSVPTVGMFTRRPLLFKQPAAFSLATGAAAASPTATVEQEYGEGRRSQEVRAAAQRPLSKTLASRSECVSGSKQLVCVSSVCEVDMHDHVYVSVCVVFKCLKPAWLHEASITVSVRLCSHSRFSLLMSVCSSVCMCTCVN